MERQDEIQVRQSAGGENERWLDDDRRVPPSRKYRLRKLTFSKTYCRRVCCRFIRSFR